MDSSWDGVRRELDLWGRQGNRPMFWVRDDDACEMSVPLATLQAFAAQYDIRIGLAIIPGNVRSSLLDFLAKHDQFVPMCHGWKHINYGSPGRGGEFGRERSVSLLEADARLALKAFYSYFGNESNPVFVPPHGRIAPALIPRLRGLGFSALSVGPGILERRALPLVSRIPWTRLIRVPVGPTFPRINVHIDPIDWTRRTACDPKAVAARLVAHLRLRRHGLVDFMVPIGILMHHLDHDNQVWRLCHNLVAFLRGSEIAQFVDHNQFLAKDQ